MDAGMGFMEMKDQKEISEMKSLEVKTLELVPSKSDYDIAKELKDEMAEASKLCCAILDKAISLGFQIQVGFGPDPMTKKIRLLQCVVSKVFE